MVRKSAVIALMLVASLAGSASLASASVRPVTRPAPKQTTTVSVNTQLNGQMAALVFFGSQVNRLIRNLVGVGKVPAEGSEAQIQSADNPDGCDPIGVKGGTQRGDLPLPANNRLP